MVPGLLTESLVRYIGRTVTIFTTSGGISGAGFTGVLACVGDCTIKLITDIGAAPACPVGSSCNCCYGIGYGGGYGNGYGYGGYGGYGNGYGNCYGNCGCGGYGGYGNDGCGCGFGCGAGGSLLGSVTEIPIDKIASFTHNAI